MIVQNIQTGETHKAKAEYRKVPPHNGAIYYRLDNGETFTATIFWQRYRLPEEQKQSK